MKSPGAARWMINDDCWLVCVRIIPGFFYGVKYNWGVSPMVSFCVFAPWLNLSAVRRYDKFILWLTNVILLLLMFIWCARGPIYYLWWPEQRWIWSMLMERIGDDRARKSSVSTKIKDPANCCCSDISIFLVRFLRCHVIECCLGADVEEWINQTLSTE